MSYSYIQLYYKLNYISYIISMTYFCLNTYNHRHSFCVYIYIYTYMYMHKFFPEALLLGVCLGSFRYQNVFYEKAHCGSTCSMALQDSGNDDFNQLRTVTFLALKDEVLGILLMSTLILTRRALHSLLARADIEMSFDVRVWDSETSHQSC